jgi:hypothetical protein
VAAIREPGVDRADRAAGLLEPRDAARLAGMELAIVTGISRSGAHHHSAFAMS